MEKRLSLRDISLRIAWATLYAKEKLDENHPEWENYFAYSEWFRHRICSKLNLPLDTKWEDIYRKVGALVVEEYSNEEEYKKAYDFGHSQSLDDDIAEQMFREFEKIKYRITERI